MAATVAAKTWITEPGGSDGREAAATSRQQRRRQIKLGLAGLTGGRQGDSKTAVIATAVAQICICGRGCGKTVATAVTTWWWSELGLEIASATEMAAARCQQQWRRKLGLQDLAAVASERR